MGRPPRGRFPLDGVVFPFHSLRHNDENIPLLLRERATEGGPGRRRAEVRQLSGTGGELAGWRGRAG